MDDQHRAFGMPPQWLSITVGIACVAAILDMPYGYYQLLRLVVTGYAAYISYIYFCNRRPSVAWVFVFFALIYNPVFPIAMTKGVHAIFNILTAGAIFGEQYVLRASNSSEKDGRVHELSVIEPEARADFAKFIAREIVVIGIIIAALIAAIVFWDRSSFRNEVNLENFTMAPSDRE